MHKTKFLPIFCLLTFTIIGCGDDDAPDNTTPTEGLVTGTVTLYDARTNILASDGMTVTVVGTTLSDVTDVQGVYSIENVPYGEIVLEYSKSGYGTFRSEPISHMGSSTTTSTVVTDSPSLGQISGTSVIQASAVISGSDISINVETSPGGNNNNSVYLTVFLSSTDDVSNTVNEAVFGPRDVRINPVDLTIDASELSAFGFSSGQTVFLKVYGDSFFSNDFAGENGTVHPNVNSSASATLSVVLP